MSEDEALKQRAREESSALAGTFKDVLDGVQTLDQFLDGKPPLVSDRKPSINHILTVFGDATYATKRELLHYLYFPHVLASIAAA